MKSLWMNRSMLLAGTAMLMLVTACEDEAAPDTDTAEQGGKAEGNVLGGTISDEMIPYEDLKSQSPPAERPAGADNGDGAGEDAPAGDSGAGNAGAGDAPDGNAADEGDSD